MGINNCATCKSYKKYKDGYVCMLTDMCIDNSGFESRLAKPKTERTSYVNCPICYGNKKLSVMMSTSEGIPIYTDCGCCKGAGKIKTSLLEEIDERFKTTEEWEKEIGEIVETEWVRESELDPWKELPTESISREMLEVIKIVSKALYDLSIKKIMEIEKQKQK